MRQTRHHLFQTPKVKLQILRTFFLAATLPILIFGIFSVVHVRKQMAKHYDSQVRADGLRVNSILFDVTTSLYTSSESIVSNRKCMTLFGSDFTDETDFLNYADISDSLATFHANTAAISDVRIYTDDSLIPSSDYITQLAGFSDEDWYQAIGKDGWGTWTCLPGTDRFGHDKYELTLIRRIGVISPQYTAYLVIRLDNNYLKNRIEQGDYQITAALDDLPAFYSSDSSLIEKPMTVPDDFNGKFYKYTGPLTIGNKNSLTNILTFRPYKTDNLFFIRVSDFSAYESINHMTWLYISIILIATLVPGTVIILFSSYFSNRITTLKTAMHQARLGDYNIIDTFTGDDELGETFEDLKATVQMIHDKEAKYYETQLNEQQLINRQQQMEFKMLASQINPHFLYNTLETIRMQALANGNRDVATSIKLLGKSMHYVLENTGTSFTTLTKELDYVSNYLAIQKLRFGDRVNAKIEIADGLNTDDYKILPLLLQPVVENAIVHGLESVQENGYVTISVDAKDPDLILTVCDNGPGMGEETLTALKKRIADHDPSDTKSIGLYNINQRIHLLYGEEFGLTVESSPGEGTTVVLTLPLTASEQNFS